MKKTNTDHVIIRNENLFCSNCGQSQVVPFPIVIPVFVAMSDAFTKMHGKCEKRWQQPVVPEGKTATEKLQWWVANGEHGASSKTIANTLSPFKISSNRTDHPHDPSDFKRCHMLLEAVPEWRLRLDELKPISKEWSNLIDNWDKLTEMLKEQMRTNKPNGMYEFMRECINPKQTA